MYHDNKDFLNFEKFEFNKNKIIFKKRSKKTN